MIRIFVFVAPTLRRNLSYKGEMVW